MIQDLLDNMNINNKAFLITTFKYSMGSVGKPKASKKNKAADSDGRNVPSGRGRKNREESLMTNMDVYNKICKEIWERRNMWLEDNGNGTNNDESSDPEALAALQIEGWYGVVVVQLSKRNHEKKRKVKDKQASMNVENALNYNMEDKYNYIADIMNICKKRGCDDEQHSGTSTG